MRALTRRDGLTRKVLVPRIGALTLMVLLIVGAWFTATGRLGLIDDMVEERQPVLILGDSLCVGARDDGGHMTDTLDDHGWDVDYACADGNPLAAGIAYISQVETVPAVVVVALGTNRVAEDEDLDEQLSTLRADLVARGATRLIWVDYATSIGGYDPENAVLHAHVDRYGDTLVTWSSRSAGRPLYFQEDTLHHTMPGKQAWVRGIVEALG